MSKLYSTDDFWIGKFEYLSTITVNCKNVCKIFTQTKLTDVLYCLLLRLRNFQKNILENKEVILH